MQGNIYKAPTIDIRRLRKVQAARETYGARAAFSVLKKSPAVEWAEARRLEPKNERQTWEEPLGDAPDLGDTGEQPKIQYIIRVTPDNDTDRDYPGVMTDDSDVMHVGKYRVRPWADKATQERERREGERNREDTCIKRVNPGRNEYKYVKLQQNFSDYFGGLWERGYSKSAADLKAREYIARDVARIESYGESWWYYGVEVVATLELVEGVTVRGESSVWGIDSDGDDTYFYETMKEQAEEAKSELMVQKEAVEKKLREKYARVG